MHTLHSSYSSVVYTLCVCVVTKFSVLGGEFCACVIYIVFKYQFFGKD